MSKKPEAGTNAESLSKVICPGGIKIGAGTYSVYCEIKIKDGKLSISGVEGPFPNGNCAGSCGQIDMGYKHRNDADDDKRYQEKKRLAYFSLGWEEALWFDFLDIWKRWHLNDMRAGCEHQEGPEWDTAAELEVQEYTQVDTMAQAVEIMAKHNRATSEELRLLKLSNDVWEKLTSGSSYPYPSEAIEELLAKDYLRKWKTEKKAAGWVYPFEHPRGLLCKPCPVCGYKYGSGWRREEIPAGVVEFLRGLPDSDRKPAWV